MRNTMFTLTAMLLGLLAAGGLRGEAKKATYANPVIDEIGPADPHVIAYKGKYYMYPTGDNRSYHVYTSKDLVNWTKGARVFAPGERNVWAPDVFFNSADKKFHLYYTVNKTIGVAVADKPDGKFVNRKLLFKDAIDAHMFRDDNGKLYMYYVQLPGFRIHVQRMRTPLEKDASKPIQLIKPTEPWETKSGRVTEGPWMLKRNKTYYLMYSGTGANSLNYAVGYATSKSPTGPFIKYPGNPIIKRGARALGPGHGCVVKDGAGKMWHVHHQQKDGSKPWNRFICLDRIWFDSEGVLHGRATRTTPQTAPTPLAQ